jgi:CRP/FNR family transcriptional regulator, anaerobic regulatory protein
LISPIHQIDIKTAFSEKLQSSFSALLPYAKPKVIAKGTLIVEQDEICTKIFLVQKGIFRTYRETQKKEFTTGFSFSGDFDTSPFSFFYELPATETIEALTTAEVLIIHKEDFWQVSKNNPELQNGVYLMLAAYVETLENRLHQNRSLTAEARYLQLIQDQPEDVKKIPLNYIASYLGITSERLSRIRKKNDVA